MNGRFLPPPPKNEPIKSYLPNSPERTELKAKLAELRSQTVEIPLFIGGEEVRTGKLGECRVPHDHQHLLGSYHKAGKDEVHAAIDAALRARKQWAALAWQERASIFLKAAELLAGPWRATLNAATMLGQSKTAFQAEIDSACELIDFWRFNSNYMAQLYSDQPGSGPGMWDRVEYRGLEGFVFAVTPFNFTSIAGNLPTAPALMGCTVVWKPASTAVYSAYFLMKLLKEAGLPDGVINMVPGSGADVGPLCMAHPELSGVHFTGSTGVFQDMWATVGKNIKSYKTYPRIVGETGGKDFIFVHKSANAEEVATAMTRGAFEFQGQKCSAASRAYVPASLWEPIKEKVQEQATCIKMGPAEDFSNFMTAVIDKSSFDKIREYINYCKKAPDAEIVTGGGCDDSKGYFIEPTVILTTNPKFRTMEEEIFGPVLTVYVYEDEKYEETLKLCDETSPYALTGAIFSKDRYAIAKAHELLEHAAGNFYINDKPTGAVVGQQPFGGSRASGTNDKAGSLFNLIRWTSVRTIKETFVPPTDFVYPFMSEK